MQPRSIARELALLILGQIPDKKNYVFTSPAIQLLLNKALDSLMQHWREELDSCAAKLEIAQQNLLDSELQDSERTSFVTVRSHLKACLVESENILNGLSDGLEYPRLLSFSNDKEVQQSAIERVNIVVQKRISIDKCLDGVMEGWRLKRLPRIDRDILRLAVVDLTELQTPVAVACNEAVDLANKYSDLQGRRMINGILRRLQNSFSQRSLL